MARRRRMHWDMFLFDADACSMQWTPRTKACASSTRAISLPPSTRRRGERKGDGRRSPGALACPASSSWLLHCRLSTSNCSGRAAHVSLSRGCPQWPSDCGGPCLAAVCCNPSRCLRWNDECAIVGLVRVLVVAWRGGASVTGLLRILLPHLHATASSR